MFRSCLCRERPSPHIEMSPNSTRTGILISLQLISQFDFFPRLTIKCFIPDHVIRFFLSIILLYSETGNHFSWIVITEQQLIVKGNGFVVLIKNNLISVWVGIGGGGQMLIIPTW